MELPLPGSLFNQRYQLERILGQGGFATVFLANDTRAQRSVAVKVLTPEGARYEPVTRARFEREVQLVARLRNPHSVTLFDYGESGEGLLFLVFELVPGRDLSAILEEAGTLDDVTIGHILRQILEALTEAHELGLLHRDIKPENIRVFSYMGDTWCVKLLDFGIAKETGISDRARITQTGAIVGTPRYMSPEQLRFEPLAPSSDIYSLGVTAYEMLMGSAAMHGIRIGDQLERLAQSQALQVPGSRGSALREVIHRMVAREPANRFQSAPEVIAALDAAFGSAAPQPQNDGAQTGPQQAFVRHVGTTQTAPPAKGIGGLAVAAVAVLLALTVAGGLVLARSSKPDAPRAVVLPMNAAPAKPVVAPPIAATDVGAPLDVASDRMDFGKHSSPGCGRKPEGIGNRIRRNDKTGREVNIYAPAGYDPTVPLPLVMLFHQRGEGGKHIWDESGFRSIADKEQILFAMPRDELSGDWTDPDDINVGARVINLLQEHYCIDFGHIYAVGNGEGSRLAEKLACQMPQIRAIATMSYRSARQIVCEDRDPIPYIHFTALHDGYLPVEGGAGCVDPLLLFGGHVSRDVPSLQSHEDAWRARQSCDGTRREYSKWRKNTCWTWDCETEFVSCHLDAGRGWPKRRKPRGYDHANCDGESKSDYDMAGEIWRFFEETTIASP